MALTSDRRTPARDGVTFDFPVAAATKIHAGALVALDASGNATKGATSTALIGVGRAEQMVDNSAGSAGDLRVTVRRGVFRWANAAGDAVTKAEIGDACYIVDDETVAKTNGSNTRSKAGIVVDVDDLGVWVNMGVETLNSPASALLAANNLSDVGTPATARANLGVSAGLGAPAFTVGSQAGDVINVAVQLKDPAGTNLAVRGSVRAYLSTSATGDNLAATAPNGGVAIGSAGVAIPLVAGKAFQLVSNASGVVDLDIEDSGSPTFYLVVIGTDGRLHVSNAITFA